MIRFLIWATPLLVVAAPVLAQPASTGAEAAQAKPKKICRTFKVTGQRIARTTCYTAEEWAELDERDKAAAKKFVDGVMNNSARPAPAAGSTFGPGPTQ